MLVKALQSLVQKGCRTQKWAIECGTMTGSHISPAMHEEQATAAARHVIFAIIYPAAPQSRQQTAQACFGPDLPSKFTCQLWIGR